MAACVNLLKSVLVDLWSSTSDSSDEVSCNVSRFWYLSGPVTGKGLLAHSRRVYIDANSLH